MKAPPDKCEGVVIWLTGLSGAGKTTLARLLEKTVTEEGRPVQVLDGDDIRKNLSKDLGYCRADRETNMRRIGYVCRLLIQHGVMVIVSAISPYRNVRDEIRCACECRFVEVYVKCPVQSLIQRDAKGLYRRAIAGEIPNFTGISDPYEEPLNGEIVVETDRQSPEESLCAIVETLKRLDYL